MQSPRACSTSRRSDLAISLTTSASLGAAILGSPMADGLDQGVDLVGGYYDAGDNVKFGLPMAFTITMLAWSAIEYGDGISAIGEFGHALEAIKWGTDYFVKAHTHPTVLWAQVGDGSSDHYCWQRPEDMTTSRRAYKVDAEHAGSEVAGETAPALAAASVLFKKSDPHYSHLLLHHAQQAMLNPNYCGRPIAETVLNFRFMTGSAL